MKDMTVSFLWFVMAKSPKEMRRYHAPNTLLSKIPAALALLELGE